MILCPVLAVAALGACDPTVPTVDADLDNAWGCAVHRTCPAPDAVAAGERLFTRAWTPGDPRAGGDGLGPLFNAESCVACHSAPSVGGAGGGDHNAVFLSSSAGVRAMHRSGTSPAFEAWRERQVQGALGLAGFGGGLSTRLKALPVPRATSSGVGGLGIIGIGGRGGRTRIERNTPALFGAGLIDAIPVEALAQQARLQRKNGHISGRVGLDAAGQVARFGWKGDVATLHDFVDQACANELGLSTERRVEPTSQFDEPVSAVRPDLSTTDVHALTAYIAALPRPPRSPSPHPGADVFAEAGCDGCHTPTLGEVDGLYSDLLLHDMGPLLSDATAFGAYGAQQVASGPGAGASEFRTPPLWGVADSGPWLHDGRASTLEQAIVAHHGEATHSSRRYARLPAERQRALVAFLETLRAPAPEQPGA